MEYIDGRVAEKLELIIIKAFARSQTVSNCFVIMMKVCTPLHVPQMSDWKARSLSRELAVAWSYVPRSEADASFSTSLIRSIADASAPSIPERRKNVRSTLALLVRSREFQNRKYLECRGRCRQFPARKAAIKSPTSIPLSFKKDYALINFPKHLHLPTTPSHSTHHPPSTHPSSPPQP